MNSIKNVLVKASNKIGGFKDDIAFLHDKRISIRFKILNILSGDRLRSFLAFAAFRVYDIKHQYDMLQEMKDDFGDELTLERYDKLVSRLEWYIERAERDIKDIWKI